MRFKSAKDQATFNKLTDELADLYVDREVLDGKIMWRARRVEAIIRRTRCKLVPRCRSEVGHPGCHQV